MGQSPLILPKAIFDALLAGCLNRKDIHLSVSLHKEGTTFKIKAGGEDHSFSITRPRRNGKIRVVSLLAENPWVEDVRGWRDAGSVIRGSVEASWVGGVISSE